MSYNVVLLPGDGIGKEITDAAIKVLNAVCKVFNTKINIIEKSFGGNSIDMYGEPLTQETLLACKDADAVLLGAVGGYKWDNLQADIRPEKGLLNLRKELDLFANIRPAKVFNSLINSSSLKNEVVKDADFIVVRELTGGIYFGLPRLEETDKAYNTMVYYNYEVERIAEVAFNIAKKRKKQLVSVDKANVLEVSKFWRKIIHKKSNEFKEITLSDMYVDNAAMQIVKNPKQFDVIVTSNLFGDILSDIAGIITGSLGMLPSASMGNKYSLYEPIHGSAPDIAGKNIANPIGTILSVAMMFKYSFNMDNAYNLIETSIENVLEKGYRTKDVFTENTKLVSTSEMAELIYDTIIAN
ncbi:MAG TPA: 3-isopropylmalate dehydrogenase [Melioribacteraceae bacterium]|nr:3-isopropylmalate dehydrogenase [Melioribacteraceae bacterium]